MKIEDLITEMQAVKAEHKILSITEVLKIFEIQALQNLARQLARAANNDR